MSLDNELNLEDLDSNNKGLLKERKKRIKKKNPLIPVQFYLSEKDHSKLMQSYEDSDMVTFTSFFREKLKEKNII